MADTSAALWCSRGTGGYETLGEAGGKWRCLKEQRKKFAITMTVNILHILVYLVLIAVTVKRGWEYFFPMLHAIILNDKAS